MIQDDNCSKKLAIFHHFQTDFAKEKFQQYLGFTRLFQLFVLELQYTLHHLQISPNKRHKMNFCAPTHCVWSCPKIQAYWVYILQDMEKNILGHQSQDAIVCAVDRLYDIFAYAAKKSILM